MEMFHRNYKIKMLDSIPDALLVEILKRLPVKSMIQFRSVSKACKSLIDSKMVMLETIPFALQVEIFKRVPVKSMVQFRSVSKAWKSLIDSSGFIAQYSALQTEPQHIFMLHPDFTAETHFSLFEDDTFPQQRVDLTPPQFPNRIEDYIKVGCSHGLLCFYGDHQEGRGGREGPSALAVIWNLSIRRSVTIVVPNVPRYTDIYKSVLGFGVCREATDPKIVLITRIDSGSDMESVSCIPWQVDVFTLSTGTWRSSYNNLHRKSIEVYWQQVDVDGFIYWLASDKITVDGGYRSYSLIISFDLKTEEIREVNLPDCLAVHTRRDSHTNHELRISKLRNYVLVIDRDLDANNPVYVVWMMEGGVKKSFTKLYTLNVNTPDAYLRAFKKSGAPMVEINIGDYEAQLVIYEINSKYTDSFRYGTIGCGTCVNSYMETLLLLDKPDLMVYNYI